MLLINMIIKSIGYPQISALLPLLPAFSCIFRYLPAGCFTKPESGRNSSAARTRPHSPNTKADPLPIAACKHPRPSPTPLPANALAGYTAWPRHMPHFCDEPKDITHIPRPENAFRPLSHAAASPCPSKPSVIAFSSPLSMDNGHLSAIYRRIHKERTLVRLCHRSDMPRGLLLTSSLPYLPLPRPSMSRDEQQQPRWPLAAGGGFIPASARRPASQGGKHIPVDAVELVRSIREKRANAP